MGRGFPIVSSTKQKLNTRIYTETELVGTDDFMLEICCNRYFLKFQRYRVLDNFLFQENRRSILLDKYGRDSISKHTKHINIRYLFITDRVAHGDMSLIWCPTGDMIGDFMTKPLQGALLRKFRDQTMVIILAQDTGTGKAQKE